MNLRGTRDALAAVAAAGLCAAARGAERSGGDRPISAAGYYFPNDHPGEPRHDRAKGRGWAEWELVKPRFLNINCWDEWTEGSYL
jgi:hypothetical protein